MNRIVNVKRLVFGLWVGALIISYLAGFNQVSADVPACTNTCFCKMVYGDCSLQAGGVACTMNYSFDPNTQVYAAVKDANTQILVVSTVGCRADRANGDGSQLWWNANDGSAVCVQNPMNNRMIIEGVSPSGNVVNPQGPFLATTCVN